MVVQKPVGDPKKKPIAGGSENTCFLTYWYIFLWGVKGQAHFQVHTFSLGYLLENLNILECSKNALFPSTFKGKLGKLGN